MHCNICNSRQFKEFNGRAYAVCCLCGSLERHRVCYEVYQQEGFFDVSRVNVLRILQFAPEKILYDVIAKVSTNDFVTSDKYPEKYTHARPLKIALPEGLSMIGDSQFDYLLHNHVWEHIPGHWKDHVTSFMRIIKKGGKMIFTIPYGSWSPKTTSEGGEHLTDDRERKRLFGQSDHVRKFGEDFITYLQSLEGYTLQLDSIDESFKISIGGWINNSYPERVFILTRDM